MRSLKPIIITVCVSLFLSACSKGIPKVKDCRQLKQVVNKCYSALECVDKISAERTGGSSSKNKYPLFIYNWDMKMNPW
ncbi:MAG: hypothetical protein ABJA79_00500 [Parafilimonas sp.]